MSTTEFHALPDFPHVGGSIRSTGSAIYATFDFDDRPSKSWHDEPSEPEAQARAHEVFLRDPVAYATEMYRDLVEYETQEFEGHVVLAIDADTTDDEIEAVVTFPDMQGLAKQHRTAGLKVYRKDDTFVLWGDGFGWVNEHSVGVGDSVHYDDVKGVANAYEAFGEYQKAA